MANLDGQVVPGRSGPEGRSCQGQLRYGTFAPGTSLSGAPPRSKERGKEPGQPRQTVKSGKSRGGRVRADQAQTGKVPLRASSLAFRGAWASWQAAYAPSFLKCHGRGSEGSRYNNDPNKHTISVVRTWLIKL